MAIPYGVIADCLRQRTVIPFFGSGASAAGPPNRAFHLPTGAPLAEKLAELGYPGPKTDALSKIAQYVEEVPADRAILLTKVASLFSDVPPDYRAFVTEFLGEIPETLLPNIVVTTNYDLLVERSLEHRNVAYVCVSHITRGNRYAGRFLRYTAIGVPLTEKSIVTRKQLEGELPDPRTARGKPLIVYKMHGTALIQRRDAADRRDQIVDSIVLTEDDYVDFLAQESIAKIPSTILEHLREAHLLFLGYSLSDWNFRVLLRRIQMLQEESGRAPTRHWAVVDSADEVEEKFWAKRSVSLYREDLMTMLKQLWDVLGVGK